jgi:AAA15 family ATPase/GTPase
MTGVWAVIINFTIENFKSFLESATIDFAAGPSKILPGNLLKHRNRERFVKSMALYGPNASGKTTVLDGLYALKLFVLFSTQDQNPKSPIPRFRSFALDRPSSKRPTRIALTIDLEGDRYTLDVSATTDRVWNETLKVQRTTRQASNKTAAKLLIERSWNPKKKEYSTTLAEALGAQLTRTAAIEQTTPNRLMLGKLASMNSDIATRIIEWFEEDLKFYDMHRNPLAQEATLTEAADHLRGNPAFAATVERFMKDADAGIQELRVVDEEDFEPVFSDSDKTLTIKESTKPGLSFRHVTGDATKVSFRSQHESSGTLRFVALLTALLKPSARRRLVCIDELSASMHPDLVRRLIGVVHSSRYNPSGNQLLFTTHDTHLMDPELLRRDQITICSKNRLGRSTTTRLDVFGDDARSDANLQKQYLQGRFGGLPQFGPTLEDVPVDDEPLEVIP